MTEEEKMPQGKELFGWDVPEYHEYERGLGWYIGLIGLGIVLLIYALRSNNFLFAFIVIMFAIIFLIHSGRRPMILKFAITEDGIALGKKMYRWKDLKRFYIIYEPPEVKNLYLEFSGVRPRLPIPLYDQDPVKIREFLLKFLYEDLSKTEEPISDWLGRFLKI